MRQRSAPRQRPGAWETGPEKEWMEGKEQRGEKEQTTEKDPIEGED